MSDEDEYNEDPHWAAMSEETRLAWLMRTLAVVERDVKGDVVLTENAALGSGLNRTFPVGR